MSADVNVHEFNQEIQMKLPEIPKGWEILPKDEIVLKGDRWSYYSILDIHQWLPAKEVDEVQKEYNVYIRKIKD